jgi:hypothetical protein
MSYRLLKGSVRYRLSSKSLHAGMKFLAHLPFRRERGELSPLSWRERTGTLFGDSFKIIVRFRPRAPKVD